MLLDTLRKAGFDGQSLLAAQLAECHKEMCVEFGWIWRQWPAVGREFKKLGLSKSKIWIEGRRLTIYQIGSPADTANKVVRHPAVERKRT